MGMGVKIRGIYSTSLTKLLLDKGFEIANPSSRIQQRLGIEGVKQADTIIYDKEDKNGVIIHGERDYDVLEVLKEELEYVAFREVKKGDIYVGELKDVVVLGKEKFILIRLNDEGLFGYLPLNEYWGVIKKGEKILVQIKGNRGGIPLLSSNLRIFGKNCVLIEKGYSEVSKHLTNKQERERLYKIAEDYQIKGYGILWKAIAENKPEEDLRKEIEELIEKLKELRSEYKFKDIGKILDGQRILFVDFSFNAKRKLDEIRDKVVKTMDYHHIIRRANIGPIIDFAERVLSLNKVEKKELKDLLIETYYQHSLPNLGKAYIINHRKLNGKSIPIKGKIIEKSLEERKLVIQRVVKKKGIYDGLNVEKEPGDIIKTYLFEGSWFVKHEYYSKEGSLKGIYYSINTPIELYPRFADYIDLEIDVVVVADERKIIDEEKLEQVKKYLTPQLYEKAIEVANLLKEGKEEKCLEKDLI